MKKRRGVKHPPKTRKEMDADNALLLSIFGTGEEQAAWERKRMLAERLLREGDK